MMDVNVDTPFKGNNLDQINAVASQCRDCPLHSTRTQVVFGAGNPTANLMIIGEGPGQQEDEDGQPFVGRSGQLLTKILASVQIDRQDIYITNIVKCRPPKNRTPFPEEVSTCSSYLMAQIQCIKPKIIALLGAAAVHALMKTTQPISTLRGQWVTVPVDYMTDDLYIMPMFHPSYMLRQSSKEKGSPKWLTWVDAKEIKTALDFYDKVM